MSEMENSGFVAESQEETAEKGRKAKGKKEDRGRAFAFLVYEDSAYPDWQERMRAAHVRGFISPCHDQDVLVDGSPKKKHWHVMWLFDGKKSRAQIDALREACVGPDFNRGLEDIHTVGAYARYLCHMDDPDKAQYEKNQVVCLGGADYDLAASMPGDETVIMAEISAYVVANDVTSVNALIAACKEEGRRDWLSYISRRSYAVGLIIGHNIKRLSRIHGGAPLPGDVLENCGCAAAN